VSDPANTQNEGKVFLYKFGKKIFDKIMDVMQPQFADEQPVNPYDFWEGADFKLKIRKVEGWVNYDKSEFATAAPLYNGDEGQLEGVYDKLYSLADFTDPKNYKSYDELKAKLNKVLGVDAGHVSMDAAPMMETAPVVEQPAMATADSTPFNSSDEGEEDTLSYFDKLAQQG
jgi:hypothetical protein